MKLSLSRRVGLLFVVGFLTLWLGAIGLVYVMEQRDGRAGLPAPERLAALTLLVEETERAQRGRLLEAVRTPYFSAWVASGPEEVASPTAFDTLSAELAQSYQAALGARRVEALALQVRERFPFLLARALNATRLHIELNTGETLIVVAESPFLMARSGLPVGFAAGLVGIVIAFATLILLHREFRPLSQLARALERVEPDGEAIALPAIRARSPELQALVGAFERLQDRIAILIRARMALIGGVQHDVRTFATRLRLRVDRIEDPDERARAVADIDDMITLLDNALLASRAGARELDQELIDLAPLVAAETADRATRGARVAFQAEEGAESASVLGDRLALRRVISNLIDNALNYGQEARLALRAAGDQLILTVDDKGPGISPEHRELLLEPFTRLEASRARRTGGSGLGLAIVRNLVTAHGGALEIDDAPGGGARLIVQLPIATFGGAA